MSRPRDLLLRIRSYVFATLALATALIIAAPSVTAEPKTNTRAAATENVDSTRAALELMRRGGNAVDAAVAAALVAGVSSPTSSGIGGGGFGLIWHAQKKSVTCLDFRETAPAEIEAAAFENRPFAPDQAGRYVGVPGEVYGLFELQRRHGKRPWHEVVAPAIDTAERGFVVQKHTEVVVGFMKQMLAASSDLGALFLPGGKPVAFGARVKNPKLASTLRRIATGGKSAFYDGPIARDIVNAVVSAGGKMTLEDLRSYRPVERKPLHVHWEGHDVYTMPAPSAGGLMLAQALRLYSKQELNSLGNGSGGYVHWVAEGLRGAIADRMRYVGDPAFENVPMDKLISQQRMTSRKRRFDTKKTHALPEFDVLEHGTHHLVTADAAGNIVSLTTTVNRPFGSGVVAPGTGIVLNDELNDFTASADVAQFGMKQSPNRARAGARPVSSMTPAIVLKDGRGILALGGSGGMTIAPNVTEVTLSMLAAGLSPSVAVAEKRFSIPTNGDTIAVEPGTAESLVKDLKSRGEKVQTQRFASYAVQLVAFDGSRAIPVADPRKHGSALAF